MVNKIYKLLPTQKSIGGITAEALKERYPQVMLEAIKREFEGSDKVKIEEHKDPWTFPSGSVVNIEREKSYAGGLKLHGTWFTLLPYFSQIASGIKDGKIYGMKIYEDTPTNVKTVTVYIPYESVYLVLSTLGIYPILQYDPVDKATTLFYTTGDFRARVSISFSDKGMSQLVPPLERRLRYDFDVTAGEEPSGRKLYTTFVSRKEDNNGESKIEVPRGYEISMRELQDYWMSDDKDAIRIGCPKPLYIGVVPFDLQSLLNSTMDKENEAFRRNIESTLKLIGSKNANLEEVEGAIYFPAVITKRKDEEEFVVLLPFDFLDQHGFLARELEVGINNFSRDLTNLFAYKIKKDDGKYYTFKCVTYSSVERKDFQPRA